jgi:sugar O-acyltransferase (sialic acid O-acetyltransferase NeuD family)
MSIIRVIGIGAGGHAKMLIEALRLAGGFEFAGLLEANPQRHGTRVHGVPVLGDDTLLPELRRQGIRHFFVGIGSVGDARARERIFELGIQQGYEPVTVTHPSAIISTSASLGRGSIILAGAIINPDAVLGANVIVNTGAIVEHDCVLGDHVHLATGACLAGSVILGNGSHVGIGASVRQGICIGARAVVGAGAVVVKNVPDGVVVAGVPARILKRTEP